MDTTLLGDMMSGGLTASSSVIESSADMQVLAVDLFGGWGAGFRLQLGHDGTARTDVVLAQRTSDGDWDERGSGGGAFGGFDSPWRPPAAGWDDGPLLSLGTVGMDTFDEDDEVAPLTVHYGFAVPGVESVRSAQGGQQRLVAVTSPVGAYVVITFGDEARITA